MAAENAAGDRVTREGRPLSASPDRPVHTAAGATIERAGSGSSPVGQRSRSFRTARFGSRGTVWAMAATLLFGSYCLMFLVITPTFYAPDEVFQFDRVMAASHGDVLVTPGQFRLSAGASKLQTAFVQSSEYLGTSTFGDRDASERSTRPSYASAGGNARPQSAVTNYMSQHPPLYYALMGGLTWLAPGSDTMHGDSLVMLIRAFNILLVLGLPALFFLTARRLAGDGIIARTAAFGPLLVPGLARSASSINNDNLTIIICAAILLFAVSVMRGDRSVRTAYWLGALCVAASLSKGTALTALMVVPVAYVVQLVRTRRWPQRRVLVVLAIGAVASALWWLRNLVSYGQVQPYGAAGAQLSAAFGPVRPVGAPVDMANFWRHVYLLIPSRFWGALGMLEPPRLPWAMIWILCATLLAAWLTAVVALPGRRTELVVLILLPAALLVGVIRVTYVHYQTFLAIPGLQGRYLYPTLFGLVFPIAVLAVLVLGRAIRWAPALMIASSLVVVGWAVYTMVDTLWLASDVSLTPSTWLTGFRQIVAFGALPGLVTTALVALAALGAIAATAITVLACRTYGGRLRSQELLPPEPTTAAPVPAAA